MQPVIAEIKELEALIEKEPKKQEYKDNLKEKKEALAEGQQQIYAELGSYLAQAKELLEKQGIPQPDPEWSIKLRQAYSSIGLKK